MYGFGYNGETGVNPGWGHTSNGWVNASFNLSSDVGQTVIIRWVFGSDPAYCTADPPPNGNPAMFGVVIDNISLGSFDHNFDDNNMQGMTVGNLRAPGGQLWHIAQVPDAADGEYVLRNNDPATGLYNPNMLNFAYSPIVTMPDVGQIRVDFQLKGVFSDQQDGPNLMMRILPHDVWYLICNPTGDPGGNQWNRYVTSSAFTSWVWFTETWSPDGYLPADMYGGQDVQFRLEWRSDTSGQFSGPMVDCLTVFQVLDLPPAKDLTIELTDGNVQLDWLDPLHSGEVEPGWIQHCGDLYNSIGWNEDENYMRTVATRFNTIQLANANAIGGILTKVSFMAAYNSLTPFTIKVWTGGTSPSSPGTLVREQVFTGNFVANQWLEVELTNPVPIVQGQEIRFGYEFTATPDGGIAAFIPCCDGGEPVANYGNLILNGNSWQTLSAQFGNWMIRGYVDGASSPVILGERTRNMPEHTGYVVYRKNSVLSDYEVIASLPQTQTSYVDTNPVVNQVNFYTVTADYEGYESTISNEESIYYASLDLVYFVHDDGIPFSQSTAFNGTRLNKFTPEIGPSGGYKAVAIEFFIQTRSSGQAMNFEIWNEGADGLPGELVYERLLPAATVIQDWNLLILDDVPELGFSSGSFFAGFRTLASHSRLGLSENTVGHTYFRSPTGQYTIHPDRCLMVRAWVDPTFVSEIDPYVLPTVLTARNYPNPFNPETTISFTMPSKGHVSVQIYNIKGQLVQLLYDDEADAGLRTITWDGNDIAGNNVSSGIYFYKVQTDKETVVNKMLLMK